MNGKTLNASIATAAQVEFEPIGGFDAVNGRLRVALVDASGNLIVIMTPGPAGGDLQTGAVTAVAAAATATLPALPANVRTQIVSVLNSAGAFIFVRKNGGVAGTGIPIVNFGVFVFSEGVVQLEAQNPSAANASVGVSWETN